MRPSRQRRKEDAQTSDVRLILRNIENDQPLSHTRVNLKVRQRGRWMTMQGTADEGGVVIFTSVPAGQVQVSAAREGFEFEHLQFQARNHKDNSVTLNQAENADMTLYMRPSEVTTKRTLDNILKETSCVPDGQQAKLHAPNQGVVSAARHVARLRRRYASLRVEHQYLAKRLAHAKGRTVLSGPDSLHLAIRIQEHLGLPKFVEEHPDAPALWGRSLDAADHLLPLVRTRDKLIRSASQKLCDLEENLSLVTHKELFETIDYHLANGQLTEAVTKINRITGHLHAATSFLCAVHDALATASDYTRKIDSPERMSMLQEFVRL